MTLFIFLHPDHHRSMQDLNPDGSVNHKHGSSPSHPSIVVNDASDGHVLDLEGGPMGESEDGAGLSIEQVKKQQRRSSWCPEEERKKEEKCEKQILLGVSGRRYVWTSVCGIQIIQLKQRNLLFAIRLSTVNGLSFSFS